MAVVMATATVSDIQNAESGGTVDPPDRNSGMERWEGLGREGGWSQPRDGTGKIV